MPTPSWQSARNGLPGDSNAIDKSTHINQLLGTHGVTPVYQGQPIVTPTAGTGTTPSYFLSAFDFDQRFTMSGTAIGRVQVPVLPVGLGADLVVSLYTDSSGVPGTLLRSVRVPAKWFTTFAASSALVGNNFAPLGGLPGSGPLMLPQYNVFRVGAWASTNWQSPAVGSAGGAANPSVTSSGNYIITMGGTVPGGGAQVSNVFTVAYAGGSRLGATSPQPPLPQATQAVTAIATSDTLVCAGGDTGSATAAVFTASWNPSTGQAGSWSAQASLPQALYECAGAASGETVYVVGGFNGTSSVNTVYYATIQNGQLQSWNTGPPLPLAVNSPAAAVIGNFLVVAGGAFTGGTRTSAVYYSPIAADGSLGPWQTGPSLPTAVSSFNVASTPNGMLIVGGFASGGSLASAVQSLTATGSGLGQWSPQSYPFGSLATSSVMFPKGNGTFQVFSIFGNSYVSATVYTVPTTSVPLPVSGLTNGATYHLVLHQVGGNSNNYLLTSVDGNGVLSGVGESSPGANMWTYFPGFALSVSVFDQTPGGQVLHTWEDSGNRMTTLAWATTPDVRLLGVAEATQFADGTLFADAAAINYPGVWPGGAWPPLGVTQL